jgi:hypothetical protein
MNWDPLSLQVEEVIRLSEIRAVADCMLAGNPVRLGQVVDYFVAPPQSPAGVMVQPGGSAHEKPYRVAVQQWHLDAAERMLQETRSRS